MSGPEAPAESAPLDALPSLPLDAGEPVFAEPWQAQAFALAVRLSGDGPVNTPDLVTLIFDYIDSMIAADRYLPPPPALTPYVFSFYDWERRTVEPD